MRLRPRARSEAIAEGSAAKKQERRDITVLVSEEAGTGRLAFGRYVAKIWDEIERVKESPRWIRRCARSKGMGYMARIPYRRRGSRAHAEQEVGAETDLHNLLWGARANLNAGQLPRFGLKGNLYAVCATGRFRLRWNPWIRSRSCDRDSLLHARRLLPHTSSRRR